MRQSVPMEMDSNLSFSSRAASSVPPVVAPWRSITPKATPQIAPP